MKNKITIERRKKTGVLVPKLNGEILEGAKNIKIYYSYGETKEETKEIVELIFENSEIEIIDID